MRKIRNLRNVEYIRECLLEWLDGFNPSDQWVEQSLPFFKRELESERFKQCQSMVHGFRDRLQSTATVVVLMEEIVARFDGKTWSKSAILHPWVECALFSIFLSIPKQVNIRSGVTAKVREYLWAPLLGEGASSGSENMRGALNEIEEKTGS